MKNCLIIVPHPDDEVLVAGAIFSQLKQQGFIVTVVFVTYGDYIPELAEVRVKETFAAKEKLRYDEIIFLGYGDGYRGGHLYEDKCKDGYVSQAGKSETYNLGDVKTYHYLKYGKQCAYTKDNLKKDIKDIVFDIRPDLIICNDVDPHPDHKALSLLFDETVGEIIKKEDYRPVILKRFAYLGTYVGPEDYFDDEDRTYPILCEQQDKKCCYPYLWGKRLCFPTNPKNHSYLFWHSDVFMALKAHKSQDVIDKFGSIVNRDNIFWVRRTDNCALDSDIQVSSGEPKYLNDFKITDTDEIRDKTVILPTTSKLWKPESDDMRPQISFTFSGKKTIRQVKIYQNPNSTIYDIKIISGKDSVCFNEIADSYLLEFDVDFNETSFLQIQILKGENVGINEIELFEDKEPKLNFEIQKYDHAARTRLPVSLEKTVGWLTYSLMSFCRKVKKWVKDPQYFYRLYEQTKCFLRELFEFIFKFLPNYFLFLFVRHPKQLWLINERPDEACDNGYVLFKWLRENHPEYRVYYAIKRSSKDFHKVEQLGNVVEWSSMKHVKYYIFSTIHCSTVYFEPDGMMLTPTTRKNFPIKGKRVFLQHGVIMNDVELYHKINADVDLFVSSAYPEREFIAWEFGYEDSEVKCLGLARYDNLYNTNSSKLILFMPTWRSWLRNTNNELFAKTPYFKTLSQFLTSPELLRYLKDSATELVFFLHPSFKDRKSLFEQFAKEHIKVINNDDIDMQALLKSCSMLVTDFSSVSIDVAYLNKPVIYYQFDEAEYRQKQHAEGYFSYKRDGFGPVLNNLQDVITRIKELDDSGFKNPECYATRVEKFFAFRDTNNCQRHFEELCRMELEILKLYKK